MTQTGKPKQHGCLTAWLILMIVANSIGALSNLFFAIRPGVYADIVAVQGLAPVSAAAFLLFVLMSVFNVVCAIALMRWQKWGFYGFIASSVAAFVMNLAVGVNIAQAALGLIGLGILYGVLNIGGENRAWPRLE
ncbi:MAG: hypothetical protein AAGF01_25400 [Cyanobacteria bacterium P01_G01_bin.38]